MIFITVHGDVTLAVEVIKIGAVDFLGAALSNRERDALEGASAGTPTADRL